MKDTKNQPITEEEFMKDICKDCTKKNPLYKCSKHFVKHPCCGSTDYNRHNHTCINND